MSPRERQIDREKNERTIAMNEQTNEQSKKQQRDSLQGVGRTSRQNFLLTQIWPPVKLVSQPERVAKYLDPVQWSGHIGLCLGVSNEDKDGGRIFLVGIRASLPHNTQIGWRKLARPCARVCPCRDKTNEHMPAPGFGGIQGQRYFGLS